MNRNIRPSILSANMLFFLQLITPEIVFLPIIALLNFYNLSQNIWVSYLRLIFYQYTFILGIALVYMLITKRKIKPTVRLNKGLSWVEVCLIFLVFVLSLYVLTPLNELWVRFLSLIGYTIQDLSDYGLPVTNSIPTLIAGIFCIGITPAICEEFLYRGIVLRAYEGKGKTTAILMSALLFSLMHCTLEQLFYTFILGLILGFIVYVTDSLWAGILLHFLFNFSSVIAEFIRSFFADRAKEQTAVSMSTFDMISLMIIFIPAIFIALYCLHLVSKNKKRTELLPAKPVNGFLSFLPLAGGVCIVLLALIMAYYKII